MSNEPTLNVTVISPQDILFQGPALSVSSKNSAGNFDLLPEHANMITFIDNQEIVIRLDKKKISFKFPMAIIFVADNQVKIYSQPEIAPIW